MYFLGGKGSAILLFLIITITMNLEQLHVDACMLTADIRVSADITSTHLTDNQLIVLNSKNKMETTLSSVNCCFLKLFSSKKKHKAYFFPFELKNKLF